MKIDALDISIELQKSAKIDTGLGHVRMRGIGPRVVLAGANGSGKSRLLQLLIKICSEKRRDHLANDYQLRSAGQNVNRLHEVLRDLPSDGVNARSQASDQLRDWVAAVTRHEAVDSFFRGVVSKGNVNLDIVSYTTRSTQLDSAETIAPDEARQRHAQMRTPGAERAHINACAYVKQVLTEGRNAKDSSRTEPADVLADKVEKRRSLEALIGLFLGASAKPNDELSNYISLFGQKDYEKTLSQGQCVLFQIACILHAQGTAIAEAVVFLDEPENHLHPAALIEVLDRLDTLITSGQIWVATHSVPLIAHMNAKDPDSLWYVDSGLVEYSGRKPEKVLNGLMGSSSSIQELRDFTLLPGQFAANLFLAECLQPPAVADANVADPQTNAITQLVLKKRVGVADRSKFRLLDFGAGRGRLLSTLVAQSPSGSNTDGASQSWLDYVAYDPDHKNAARCREVICAAFDADDATNRHFSNIQSLTSKFDAESFDVVVMCNVLHEIAPAEWTTLFGSSGTLTSLLKPDGGLLVVEDYEIPAGELAHEHGFMLLNEFELKALTAWEESDGSRFLTEESRDEKYGARLRMHWIQQPLIARITGDTRKKAIRRLQESSETAIKSQRLVASKNRKHGHAYALAAQLYANASIWLNEQA